MKKDNLKRASPTQYSEQFKRAVVEEYLSSGLDKVAIQIKYGIKGKSSINYWLRVYGYVDPYRKGIKLELANQPTLAKEPTTKSIQTIGLEAKIKLLERQLEDERLRTEMLNRMVDLAEKTYKITVRKNSDTK